MSDLTTAVLPRARLEMAADWWARIQDNDIAPEEVAAWQDWLEADEQNQEAYRRIQEMGLRLAATGREQAAGRYGATVLNAARLPRRLRRAPLALAASVVALVVAVTMYFSPWAPRPTLRLSTPVAALEQAPLPDGSSVMLGGATSVEAFYTPKSRDLNLREGEAYFEVQHERGLRPFVVKAGPVSIRALGTAFNVRKTSDRVAVTVTEGRVQVSRNKETHGGVAVKLGAGEQLVYDPVTDRLRVLPADSHLALSWRERRLEFIDEPLDAVIANINRYSPRQIELHDPDRRLHEYTYTGTFDPETLHEWLIAIQRSFPIEIKADGERLRVALRR